MVNCHRTNNITHKGAALETGFIREYKLRRAITGKDSIEVTLPFEFVHLAARKNGLSVDELIERGKVQAEYNEDRVIYTVVVQN
jgi:hypothetical protein